MATTFNYPGVKAGDYARQHNGNIYNHNTNNYSLRQRRSDETLREDGRNRELLKAAAEGQTRRVEYLIQAGADRDYSDDLGFTALHHAALSGFEDTVEVLISSFGLDVNAQSLDYGTPLCLAAAKARRNVVHQLLSSRAKVETDGGRLGSPLHAACGGGDAEIARLLLETGAPVALQRTIASRGVVDFLQDFAVESNEEMRLTCHPIHLAAGVGAGVIIKVLVAAGASLKILATFESGGSKGCQVPPLHLSRDAACISQLTNCGADVDGRDSYGRTLAMIVAANGELGLLQFLVAKGASLHARIPSSGRTVLQCALQNDRVECATFLATKGAILDRRDMSWCRSEGGDLSIIFALAMASREGECVDRLGTLPRDGLLQPLEALQDLCANGLELDICWTGSTTSSQSGIWCGHTALTLAIEMYASADLIDGLLGCGANFELENIQGNTPCRLAKSLGREDLSGILLVSRPATPLSASNTDVKSDTRDGIPGLTDYRGSVRNGNIYDDVQNHYGDAPFGFDKIRRELFVTDPEIDRKNLMLAKGERAKGTCEWIGKHEKYQSWLTGEPSVLVVSGGPGKGKTMLADFVISSIEGTQAKENGHCVAYFFCLNAEPTRNNIVSILRGLIWQIVTVRKDLVFLLKPHFELQERRKAALSSPDLLWSILLAIASDPSVRKLLCVIDGLDECDHNTIVFLADKLRSADRSLALHVVIFSRPEHSLRSFAQISLDQEELEIGHDLATFIDTRIEELDGKFALDQDFKQELHDHLASRAEGTFLWTGFAIAELLRQRSRTGMRECLLDLPMGLPAFYARILDQVSNSMVSRCRVVLQWAAMAVQPLCLAEMAEVLRVSGVGPSVQERGVRDIVAECGGILVNQDDIVTLVHRSAREYLCNESQTRIPAKWHMASSKSHADMLRICVKTLESSLIHREAVSRCEWDASVGSDAFDGTAFAFQSSLLRYAIKNLSAHARLIEDPDSLIFGEPFFFQEEHQLRRNWNESLDIRAHERDDRYWLACGYDILPWLQYLLTHRKGGLMVRDPVKVTRKSLAVWHNPATLLKVAIKRSNVAMARLLLDFGAEINGAKGQWALHYAVYRQSLVPNLAMIQLLVERGAKVKESNPEGKTPLHYAAVGIGVDTLAYLLESGASVNAADRDGRTALMTAAIWRRLENVRCLLQRGALVDAKDVNGKTALHFAAEKYVSYLGNDDSHEILKILLEHGADCLVVDAESSQAVDIIIGTIRIDNAPVDLRHTAVSNRTRVQGSG